VQLAQFGFWTNRILAYINAKKTEETIDPFTSGGLKDEDAFSDRSAFAFKPTCLSIPA
jgi:hypothetical protein